MKSLKHNLHSPFIYLSIISLFYMIGCGGKPSSEEKQENPKSPEGVIAVSTDLMNFDLPDSIPSGWVTFNYENNSEETHFYLIEKYPEEKTIEDGKKEILPVFQEGMDLIIEGKNDEAMAAFGKLPEWYGKVKFVGGSGLVSAHAEAINSLKLDPGYYVMECYVKMKTGQFHSFMGMVEDFTVVEQQSSLNEPIADIELTISSKTGITNPDTIKAGDYRFGVTYEDQIVHENFVGHDVNLVKLEGEYNLEELVNWINWAAPNGLTTPTPKGFNFMGGTNDMLAGTTGYFEVSLTPGAYVLISEVPNSQSKNMLKQFYVK